MQDDYPNKSLDKDPSQSKKGKQPSTVDEIAPEISAELASIESGEKMRDAPAEPALAQRNLQANMFIAEPVKKSNKGLWMTVSAIILALVFIPVVGMGYWYTNVRIADSEYDKAIASVNAMMDAAKSIEGHRDSVKDNSTLTTTASAKLIAVSLDADAVEYLNELKTAKEKAAEFLANSQALSRLAVVSKDESVKSVYDTSKKIIEDYGKSADEFYRTGHEFMTIMAYCQAGADAIQEPGLTSEKFTSDMKSCNERLTMSESLTSKKFNDLIYKDYREAFLRMMTVSNDLLSAKTQSQYDKAYDAFVQVQKDISAIDTSRIDEIQPTQMPKDQLARLKDKLEERRQLFFR